MDSTAGFLLVFVLASSARIIVLEDGAHSVQQTPIPSAHRDARFLSNQTHADIKHVQSVYKQEDQYPICKFSVTNRSIKYFQSRLETIDPHFVQFRLSFTVDANVTSTPEVFKPYLWFWTFVSPRRRYPYLSWNIDYGVLSFGLLETQTLGVDYIQLNITNSPCSVKFGYWNTTLNIAKALTDLVESSKSANLHKYEKSYFCFLSVKPGIINSLQYQLALYLDFPVDFINYNCCRVSFCYTNNTPCQDCYKRQMKKWNQCLELPYFIGVLLFLYSPIVLFEVCAWLTKKEKIVSTHYRELGSLGHGDHFEGTDADNWVFLDGNPPVTIVDCFSFLCCNMHNKCPIFLSRLRRFFILLFGPAVMLLQAHMYRDGMGVGPHKIYVRDLAQAGAPLGFLSLLADTKDNIKVFVPIFGGPVCLVSVYYIVGFLIIVVPTSVKQIVENGLQNSRTGYRTINNMDMLPVSPFCFSTSDVISMAALEMPKEPGYKKAATLFKGCCCMLFTGRFWASLWAIQRGRFSFSGNHYSLLRKILKIALLPLLSVLCLLESLLCVVFYAVPLFNFVVIMLKGYTRGLLSWRSRHNRFFHILFGNPVTICIGIVLVLVGLMFFAYAFCLLFVASFSFIAQIVMFCFVAVIVNPSVSFGYLFFFLVLVFYLARLIRDFGDGYLELLSVAVERSLGLETNVNYVTIFDGQLVISNVRAQTVRKIIINDKHLEVSQNSLRDIHNVATSDKVRRKGNVHGIPKDLFNALVLRYRPMHIQFLKLVFHLGLIIVLIIVTMSITSKSASSGPTSEISDVMHVIFMVTVGALPRVLEVAMVNESEVVRKDIEGRNIEQFIITYWESQNQDVNGH